jgi:hypothetical protein
MLSAAMTMAAAQASKKAFIVFHLAGLAECESNMMPGYVLYKVADRHDGSSPTGPYVFFATERYGDTIQSPYGRRDESGAPTMSANAGG